MKYARSLFLVALIGSFTTSCLKLKTLVPPSPKFEGIWQVNPFEISDLPAWYVAKYNIQSTVVSPTYTTYLAGELCVFHNVTSLTFTNEGTFSEEYIVNGGIKSEAKRQIDSGTWAFRDTVLTLNISNSYPHKLIYLANTDQLVTEKFRQTAIREDPATLKRDTITYTVRLFYSRKQ